jgi:hypothetical protein
MLKLIESFGDGISLVELPDGSQKYLAHGIFGEQAARAYDEGEPVDLSTQGGEDITRLFKTKESAEAYWQGVNDCNGWEGFVATDYEKHVKMFTVCLT